MSIQSSINQAVNGMMSMIMPMSLLKEQGKVKQIKAEQEALKKTNEKLKTSNDELTASNDELRKGYEKELELWDEVFANSPAVSDPAADFLYTNPYSVGDQMAATAATQRVQAEYDKRKAQMERLQKAFQNIGMGGGNV